MVGIVGFPMLRKRSMIRKGTIISWAMYQAVTFGLDKKESVEDKEFCTHISSPSPVTPCPQSCSMISVHVILLEASCSRPLPPIMASIHFARMSECYCRQWGLHIIKAGILVSMKMTLEKLARRRTNVYIPTPFSLRFQLRSFTPMALSRSPF